jgi:hypothetical protein
VGEFKVMTKLRSLLREGMRVSPQAYEDDQRTAWWSCGNCTQAGCPDSELWLPGLQFYGLSLPGLLTSGQ